MATFGKVVAQFATFVVDAGDADETPDFSPLKGKVTFTPNTDRIIDNGPTDAVIMGSSPITAVLDDQGYLSTPAAGTQAIRRGIWLPATDNTQMNPTRFQYNVTYDLYSFDDRPISIPSHIIDMPAGSTLNLARVVPPASAPSIGTSAAEAAAAIAVDALLRSVRLVNGIGPDANGNVTVSTSGGTGPSTPSASEQYTAAMAPPAAADMPVITLVTSANLPSGLTLYREKRLGDGTNNLDVDGDTRFLVDGAPVYNPVGANPNAFVAPPLLPGGSSQAAAYTMRTATVTNSSVIAFKLRTPTTSIVARPRVNGKFVKLDAHYFTGLSAGGEYYLVMTFPGDATREVSVETHSIGFGGAMIPSTKTMTRPAPYDAKFGAIGDSYWGGAGNSPNGAARLETAINYTFRVLEYALGIRASIANLAIGGTGNVATTNNYITRADAALALGLDYLFVGGSRNDGLDAGILAAVQALQVKLKPIPRIITSGPATSEYAANNDMVRQGALPTGTPGRLFVDLLNPSALITSSDLVVGEQPQPIHPTFDGHQKLALGHWVRLAPQLSDTYQLSVKANKADVYSRAEMLLELNARPTFDQAGVELAKKAALAHLHDAADITSGLIAPDRVGLTTANTFPYRTAANVLGAMPFSSSNVADTLVRRTSTGAVAASTAVANTDAVPLVQMNTALGLKADATTLATKADLVSGVIPTSQIPALALVNVVTVASQSAMLALTSTQVQPGDIAIRTDTKETYILTAATPGTLSSWTALLAPSGSSGAITSVNGQTGVVVLGKTDIGLGNVDNTTDLNKPISNAVQVALNQKVSNDGFATYQGQVSTSLQARALVSETYNRDYLDAALASANNQAQVDALGTKVDAKATVISVAAGTTAPPALTPPNTLLFVRKGA